MEQNEVITQDENKLDIVIAQSALESDDKQSLKRIFDPYFLQADEWVKKANGIIITNASQRDLMTQARTARLSLRDIRINVEKTRKQLKEDSLRKGKAIDGIANVIKYLIEPIEAHLEEQEKFIEIQEKKKKDAVRQERLNKLIALEVDGVEFYDLLNMNDDNFQILLNNSEILYKNKIELRKRQEQEAIEKQRIELEEKERQFKEIERLQAEAAAREKAIADQKKKEDVEKAQLAEISRKEIEVKEQAIRTERLAREKAEAELREKQAAEAKEKAVQLELARQKKLAPEKEKIIELSKQLDGIQYPKMSSDEGKALLKDIQKRINELSLFILKSATKL
jgi:hypothetical protein